MQFTSHHYHRRVAQLSILSGILAFGSILFLAAGTAFHFEVFSEPEKLLGLNRADSQYLKWSMILDMFGYYLLLLPALFYFKQKLRDKTPWHGLLTWCGSAYIFLGAFGAAILSVVCPYLMVAYPISDATEQLIMANQFRLILEVVHGAMWNTLEVLLGATWWLGIGYAVRKEQPAFAYISLVLGLSCALNAFGTITGNAILSEIGLNIYLLLAIVWAIYFGISLLKKKKQVKFQRMITTASPGNGRSHWSLVN